MDKTGFQAQGAVSRGGYVHEEAGGPGGPIAAAVGLQE